MALTTYTELKASVADWLNRTDLTSAIPDFITLAEAVMNRDIHRITKATTIYVSSAAIDPPTDFASVISITLDSGSAYQDKPLRQVSPIMLAERKARAGGVAQRPDCFAYYDDQLQFAPEPDQSYDAILVYEANFTALSGSNASNTILAEAPDAYLFGTLAQAAPYLENDERVPVWEKKFRDAIDGLNAVRDTEEYGGGVLDVRLPRVLG